MKAKLRILFGFSVGMAVLLLIVSLLVPWYTQTLKMEGVHRLQDGEEVKIKEELSALLSDHLREVNAGMPVLTKNNKPVPYPDEAE